MGEKLYAAIDKLAAKYPDHIMNIRGKGQGTYIAFDTKDPAALVKGMKGLGINIGTCGVHTVRLRPMLIFEESHSKCSL